MIFPFLLSSHITADTYVKENVHFDGKYFLGSIELERDYINEWWFGNRRVSVISRNFRVTLDKKNQRMIVVNLTQQTYVEISLTLNPLIYVDEEGNQRLKFYRITGTLEKTPGKKQIREKTCDMYVLNEKICSDEDILTYENKCFFDLERKAAVTADVPFDWRLKLELSEMLRIFFNPKRSYLNQLRKMNGYVYASQNILYLRAGKLTYSTKTVEISEKEAPADIYNSPGGIHKNKTLSFAELNLLMRLLYTRGV